MKIFISYGSDADQVTALRLQALGNVNGLTVYVPPAFTRRGSPPSLDQQVQQELSHAEVILGVVGIGVSEACRQELNFGMRLAKNVIVMATPAFAAALRPHFESNLVTIDPANPDRAEIDIVHYLKSLNATQNVKKALIALGTLALGLLIFAPATSD